jgi:dienelactone hydrolase
MKFLFSFFLFLIANNTISFSQEIIKRDSVSVLKYANVSYKSGGSLSAYETERCKLDIYIPKTVASRPFPIIVYFYGGGLVEGDKTEGWVDGSNNFGYQFIKNGVAMVMVNYRLSGQHGTKWPAYIENAAAAVAWVANNISHYGGDSNRVFVAGFSAGGYLTHMLGIDDRWFSEINFDRTKIKGFISISGQTRAHGTVAADLQMPQDSLMLFRPDAMPLGHVKKTNTPIYIFVGEKEGKTITDNYDYYNQLKSKGNKNLFIYTNPGKDHGGMRDGLGDEGSLTRTKILNFIKTYSNKL